MRMTKLFSQTLRETPADAEITSHRLLLRAGYIRQLASGVFSYLPLARKTLDRIENIMRREMDAIGGQEITMPVVQPADIWKETERWFQVDAEMGRMVDRTGRDLVLAMTHEEVVADLVRNEVHSYRQLPMLIYHVQTKWRDDPRPRAGLIRVREFTMKDSYSLDLDWEGLDEQYKAHYQSYFNIFHRCDLPVMAVIADVGMMGGKLAHEFMYLTEVGEDTILICDSCGYATNRQIAVFRKTLNPDEELRESENVATPGATTIEELAQFLGVPKSKTAKAVFMMAEIPRGREIEEKFVFAVVRGDMEVNETKLANSVGARSLRPAIDSEIIATGAVPGYASPIGLNNVLVVVDDVIPNTPNMVAGTNKEGFHTLNVNYGRDYQADIVADITAAQDGDMCPDCEEVMKTRRGVEVANIFKLGTRYSDSMGCFYLDKDGKEKPVIMGSYGIGSGRLLACIVEEHHDEKGLILPITIAPYQVHLVSLGGKKEDSEVIKVSEELYDTLSSSGIDVLYDDRNDSPGVKFNDADLMGIPIRITVSRRTLESGGVEFKRRDGQEKNHVLLENCLPDLIELITQMENDIDIKVQEVPNKDR